MADQANQNGGTGTTGAAATKPAASAQTASLAPLASVTDAAKPGSVANPIAPATAADIEASGAIAEPGATAGIPVDHPAIDNNPRASVPDISNRIDLNDPTMDGPDAVAAMLKAQGKGSDAAPAAPQRASDKA